jgi:tRNA A37 N6-isopentenylltransferase MiaA
VRAAQGKVDAAQSARDALGRASASDSVRDALVWLDVADRGSADRARRIDRQVSAMLPAGAVQAVRKLMQQIVQQEERERAREQRRGRGLDIN